MSRPWTIEGLPAVHVLATAGSDLAAIADATGRFKVDVDLALWALVGRTPEQALDRLNGGADRDDAPALPVAPRSSVLGAFVRQLFA